MSEIDKGVEDASGWELYKRLFKYTDHMRHLFAVAIVGMALYALTDTALIWIMEPLLDDGLDKSQVNKGAWIPYAIFGLLLIRGLGGLLSTYFMSVVGRGVIARMRTELFGKLAKLPTTSFDNVPSAHYMSKFTYDIEQVSTATTSAVTKVVRSGLTMVGLIGIMFYQSAMLAATMFVVGPLIVLVVRSVSKRFRKIASRIQKSIGGVNNTVSEAIRGSRELKIYAQHGTAQEQFRVLNEQNTRQYQRQALVQGISIFITQMIGAAAVTFVIAIALSDSLDLTRGEMISFFGAMMGLLSPLRGLMRLNASIQKAITAAYSVFSVIDAVPEPDDGKRTLAQMQDITFDDVSFRYDGHEELALNQVNFELRAGQVTALVGRSGSGKSTVISLLARFYDPTAGGLHIDGHDLRDYQLASYRDKVAYVAQAPMLFNTSIRDNINFGAAEPLSDERLDAVLDAANLREMTDRLEHGVDTVVGESGTRLSGGQRQRIAIARALAKDAPLLILDEATSALDNDSERKVQAALDELMRGRTTIVVAHRLSTIRNADKVIVMDDGCIVEVGGYDELANKGGAFAHLLRQSGA